MTRLKELKSKSEDSGGKARQYLDGLLKIPFGVYKRENCLMIMDEIKDDFSKIVKEEGSNDMVKNKKEYTIVDILNYIHNYSERLLGFNKTIIVSIVKQINHYVKNNALDNSLKIQYVGVTKEKLIQNIKNFVENHSSFYIAPFDKMRTKILRLEPTWMM